MQHLLSFIPSILADDSITTLARADYIFFPAFIAGILLSMKLDAEISFSNSDCEMIYCEGMVKGRFTCFL